MSDHNPTQKEYLILKVLWKLGPSTVRDVHEELIAAPGVKKVGYTTTLKMMQMMHAKGFLDRNEDGVSHIYKANISEKEDTEKILDEMVDRRFRGSASKLVLQVLGKHKASQKELNEIRAFLDDLENEDDDH